MAAIELSLEWQGDLLFSGRAGDTPITLDGNKVHGLSPVQALACGLAGCMAIDIVHILDRMRTPATAVQVRLRAERAEANPKRIVAATIDLVLEGDIPDKNVQRAIDLSRETYCSVWHSLRRDIELEVSFTVR